MAKDEARRQVDAANRKLSEATKARSAAAMASLYTENATFIAADGTVVSGRSAIETMWKGRIEAGLKGLELETITLEDLGPDSYVEVGRYRSVVGENEGLGRYMVIWKQNGKGEVEIDVDVPVPNPAA